MSPEKGQTLRFKPREPFRTMCISLLELSHKNVEWLHLGGPLCDGQVEPISGHPRMRRESCK